MSHGAANEVHRRGLFREVAQDGAERTIQQGLDTRRRNAPRRHGLYVCKDIRGHRTRAAHQLSGWAPGTPALAKRANWRAALPGALPHRWKRSPQPDATAPQRTAPKAQPHRGGSIRVPHAPTPAQVRDCAELPRQLCRTQALGCLPARLHTRNVHRAAQRKLPTKRDGSSQRPSGASTAAMSRRLR